MYTVIKIKVKTASIETNFFEIRLVILNIQQSNFISKFCFSYT